MIQVFSLSKLSPVILVAHSGCHSRMAGLVVLANLSPPYVRENMVLALGEDGERRWRVAAIAHAGRQSLELPKIWLRPLNEVAGRAVKISGWELAENAMRDGKESYI